MAKIKTATKKNVAALRVGTYGRLRGHLDHGAQGRTLKNVGPCTETRSFVLPQVEF
jgi:hypothetical protein